MNKNSVLLSKTNIAVFLAICLVAGFICSRALLSVATILFGLNGLRGIHPRQWLKQRWWLAGLCWVALYALTYFWSDDTENWGVRLQTKLPVLLLPLAFAFMPAFSPKQLRVYTIGVCLLLLSGIAYSLSFMPGNMTDILEAYRVSKVLRTPAKSDHIRFSTTVAIFIVWLFYYWKQDRARAMRIFIAVCVAIMTIYLHILAAKSGLLTLYLFFFAWCLYVAISKSKLVGISLIAGLAIFAVLAVRYVPTLNQRANYIRYTILMYQQGDRSGLYGDVGRVMSYSLAWQEIQKHPLTGVGTGDMMATMKAAYQRDYPQVAEPQQLLPHNQFLIAVLGGGLFTFLAFAFWVFMPLTRLKRNRESFYFFMVWLMLLLLLMIEPMLEVQLGVFVYLFFLLWQMHTLPKRKNLA